MEKEDLLWVCTGNACPEQYEVFCDGKMVAYIRERWGGLTVECPDVCGKLVYDEYINKNESVKDYEEEINEAVINFYSQKEGK